MQLQRKIRLDKIDCIIVYNAIIWHSTLKFPENSGYRRFHLTHFTAPLHQYGLSAMRVRSCEMLKVGIYDFDGDSHDILFHILKYCSDVKLSQDFNSYQYELEGNDELGASAVARNI